MPTYVHLYYTVVVPCMQYIMLPMYPMEPTRTVVWICDACHLYKIGHWVSQHIEPTAPGQDNQLSAEVECGWVGGRGREVREAL